MCNLQSFVKVSNIIQTFYNKLAVRYKAINVNSCNVLVIVISLLP